MSGLIKSQVLSVLGEVQRRLPEARISVIAVWQPWILLSHRRQAAAMRTELGKLGIALENRPFALLPSRFFLYHPRTLPLLAAFVRLTFRLLGLGRFHLVHARAYMAGLAAASLKERYGYKYIFDMRSLFPEENVTSGNWALGSPVFRKWKAYERYAVERSDAHIAVSAPMKEDADRIAPPRTAELIHLNADFARLGYDAAGRERLRRENGWEGCFVIAYVGGLAFGDSWNNVHNYADYFRRLDPLIERLRMVFLVPEIHPGFPEAFAAAGIPADRIRFLRGVGDLRAWLSAADAGIQVMSPGPDSHTRFGVKVAEYLACGLPVIANSNAGAAADFVEAHGVGIRLDPGEGFAGEIRRLAAMDRSRERIAAVARGHFSLPVIGESYRRLYARLLGIAVPAPGEPVLAAEG